ncbi:MAG: ATP-dependent DNA helicase [Verrucomicrobiales bacterium]|nr:ATP-dependent DNA helicase [Verrucomicrobiales bacterium]
MNEPVAKPIHTVPVRDLVEFVLRRGDLAVERQFVGSDRAMAGIRGHQKLQRSRPSEYQTEVSVEHHIDAGEFILHIRGRIDGVLPGPLETLIEEIKTVVGTSDPVAHPLHWAQAKIYGFLYAQLGNPHPIVIQLSYLNLETDQVTEFRQTLTVAELSSFFTETTTLYVDWLRIQQRWEQTRNQSIRALTFPFPAYRSGQRELAVAAYRTVAKGGRLFLSAPTGIGKTLSVLFPAVKALGEGRLEHLFYLTARTVGRTIAEKAVSDLRQSGLKLRSVTLTAKEKVCVRDGHPCDALTCPLAIGYYDRLRPALTDVLSREEITRAALEAVGQKHQVCPFELSLDTAVWADLVICDYNYVFDPQAYLRRFFEEESGDYAFLVDEAHNLVDRARDMFSADLDSQELQEVKRAVKSAAPRCARALNQLYKALQNFADPEFRYPDDSDELDPALELDLFPTHTSPSQPGTLPARRCEAFPPGLINPLDKALLEAEKWLVRNQPAEFRERLLALYFRLRAFRRTAELYDDHFATLLDEGGPAMKIRLFCMDPSALLREAMTRGKATVFFSATLTPIDYYRHLLGGAMEDRVVQLGSPFPPENLSVLIHDRINTSFKKRAHSISDVVAAIATLVRGRRGNYLVYFPSYQYLSDVLNLFQINHPSIRLVTQHPGMTELERHHFLASFSVEHDETVLGFAVLGGVFGEGIDLVGERLIGAIIVSVGLPQLCAERNVIRDHFEQQNGSGFEYAYTFPGMNRVLQAIGRVIRSETDRGIVLLIDSRFSEPRYRQLFPPWWHPVRVTDTPSLTQAVESAWLGLR